MKCDVLFVDTDDNRGFCYNGVWHSHLLDSINHLLIKENVNTYTVSRYMSWINDNVKYGNIINIEKYLKYHYIPFYLYKFMHFNINRKSSDAIESRIFMWLRILENICPKHIIGIQPPAELCIAAHIKGIWIADLQHGVYEGSYYNEEYRAKYNQLGWPSCFLCWDDHSEKKIKKVVEKYSSLKVIGNPWFNRFILDEKDDDIVRNTSREADFITHDKKNILVTLQHNIEGQKQNLKISDIDFGIPLDFLKLVIEETIDINWLIRIHPIVLSRFSPNVVDKYLFEIFHGLDNIEWKKSSTIPLPLILKNTDMHITYNSSVAIEASWFGIQTIMFTNNISDLKTFDFLINNRFVKAITNDKDKLIECILSEEIFKNKKTVYKKNIKNYSQFISKIINNNI